MIAAEPLGGIIASMRRLLFVSFTVTVAALGACGSPSNNFNDAGGGDASTDTSTNDTGVSFQDVGPLDAPACTQCSADLHEVLTCGDNPQVVQTCTGDTGCGATGCIAACDAAAQNKSSVGCDYYSMPSDGWNTVMGTDGTPGSCFAAFVTNNWSTDMNVSLVWKGTTINGNDLRLSSP